MKTIKCDTKQTFRNKKTNQVYLNEAQAMADVKDLTTDTTKEDIVIDTNIIVPGFNLFGDSQ
jgi:hypothetical protein|tara:strand:- start:292 stop:477 length:186 start_codon:yes stop_codon:yes gene_type:complete